MNAGSVSASPQDTPILLSARWVFPVAGELIVDGGVVLQGAHIAGIGPSDQLTAQFPSAVVQDLGNRLILPGLVNAHTHLELSFLHGQTPYNGNFVDWVREVARRRTAFAGDYDKLIRQACTDSLSAGVTTIGDISVGNRAWRALREQPIRKTCFAEVFGITAEIQAVQDYLTEQAKHLQGDELMKLGISPHAPYSVGQPLYEAVAVLAQRHGLPVTTHLAETHIEETFLRTGQGPWQDYLKELDKWDGSFHRPGCGPVEYLLRMNLSGRRFLLAHVNYLTDSELSSLAKSSHYVVFCPRAHRFFGHENHRFREMLAGGIPVCLGTDSLGSNDSLSILDEMRFLYREYPGLDPADLIRIGTINGAMALGWKSQTGTLEIGKAGDLIAVSLPENADSPCETLLRTDAVPDVVYVHGRQVVPGEQDSDSPSPRAVP